MDFISLPSALEHIRQGFVKCATAVLLFFEGMRVLGGGEAPAINTITLSPVFLD